MLSWARGESCFSIWNDILWSTLILCLATCYQFLGFCPPSLLLAHYFLLLIQWLLDWRKCSIHWAFCMQLRWLSYETPRVCIPSPINTGLTPWTFRVVGEEHQSLISSSTCSGRWAPWLWADFHAKGRSRCEGMWGRGKRRGQTAHGKLLKTLSDLFPILV